MGDEDNIPHDFARGQPARAARSAARRLPQSSAVHISAAELVAIVVEDR